jgi:hypothetical protein
MISDAIWLNVIPLPPNPMTVKTPGRRLIQQHADFSGDRLCLAPQLSGVAMRCLVGLVLAAGNDPAVPRTAEIEVGVGGLPQEELIEPSRAITMWLGRDRPGRNDLMIEMAETLEILVACTENEFSGGHVSTIRKVQPDLPPARSNIHHFQIVDQFRPLPCCLTQET